MFFQPESCGFDVATMLGLGRDSGEAEQIPQFLELRDRPEVLGMLPQPIEEPLRQLLGRNAVGRR